MKIIVNGREHEVDESAKDYVMYAEIVALAGKKGTPTVTWRARSTGEGGTLLPTSDRAVLSLRDGLIFNVAHTDNA